MNKLAIIDIDEIERSNTIKFDGSILSNRMNRHRKLDSSIQYLRVKTNGINYLVHRLVATKYLPNPNKYKYVNYKDGNKRNNHVSNLEWVTAEMNRDHASKNLLLAKKLNPDTVNLIRKNYKSGWFTQQQIADNYGICIATVNEIIHNKIWKNI